MTRPATTGVIATIAVACSCLWGCVSDEHPRATGGAADFQFDGSTVIFAADMLDEAGRPVLPRQAPYEKTIRLQLTNAGAPDEGAYVDVQLDPPDVLQFLAGSDDSCRHLSGAFRCTAQEDGFAHFIVRSESDWSGEAELTLIGRAESDVISVHPAGLPENANNFSMVVEGVDTDKVPARYNALGCSLTPQPDNTFDKWPQGAVRVREAEVRATAPSNAPGVIEHAPVIIETLHPEVFVTRDPTCEPPRDSRLRVQLDELGRSPKFYFCFSDIGGDLMQLAFSSGVKTGEPKLVSAEPEPRLLRVTNIKSQIEIGFGQLEVVAVSVFDANLDPMTLSVDVKSSDPSILAVNSPSAIVHFQGDPNPTVLFAEGTTEGTARIQVSPELHDEPLCESEQITVVLP